MFKKAEEIAKEAEQMKAEHGEKMREYLKPYMDLDDEKSKSYATGTENDRRQVANTLKGK